MEERVGVPQDLSFLSEDEVGVLIPLCSTLARDSRLHGERDGVLRSVGVPSDAQTRAQNHDEQQFQQLHV